MAKYNVDSLPQIISLGKQGENRARAITIDCGEMLTRWSGAEIVLRAMRPGESTPYIVTTTIDSNGVMTWEPDSADTAIAGTGRAELMCTVDGCVEKSAVFATSIKAALSDTTGDKADAPSSWTQKVLDAVGTITETAEQVSNLISGVGATAVTLDAGADATVTSDGKTLTFGIPRGAQGLQGIQGERGEKGDKGDTGAKGDKGDTGEQGAQGIQGERGLQGVQGVQGEKGEKGDTGAQGIQGERGLQGVQGIQGEKGEKGDKGDTGVQGVQGVQGEKGADGVSPSAKVTKSGTVTTITITDESGTTTAEINDGEGASITDASGNEVTTVGSGLTVTNAGVMSVTTTDTATSGSTTPITSGGVYTLLGDVESLLKGV